jgi:hypothetical protein
MKITKQLGVWMDHSIAYLMELTNDTITTNTVDSQSFYDIKEENLSSYESLLNHKKHNQLSDYFKRLSEMMKDYDEILLFGPTGAKNELLNLLKKDHHFDKIKIELKQVDKMTANQQQAFVKEYFNPSKKVMGIV